MLDREKGSLLALDEFGNVKGGIRNTYVDVPVKTLSTPVASIASAPDSSPSPVPRGASARWRCLSPNISPYNSS